MLVDIASISLDVQNFRHSPVGSERDAMRLLLSDEKQHKVLELAQDIVELGGLDPSQLLIITEDAAHAGHFVALEGNRRITALKTMITPDIAQGFASYQAFKRLGPAFMALGVTRVECVVLDRHSASQWIRRKHYKGMGGRGTLPWNAVATARSDAAEGKYTRWMTALAYLEENGIDAEELRDRISRKTTSVERVLGSPLIGSELGLRFDRSGKLTPDNGRTDAACRLVEALLEAMAEPGFTEPTVSTAEQQRTFIGRFLNLSVTKARNEHPADQPTRGDKQAGAASGSETQPRTDGKGGPHADGPKSAGNPGATQTSKTIRLRKKFAVAGLRISNVNLNKFYAELKSLNVESYPFISSAIIRVFLEKSTTVFLETMAVPPLDGSAGASWRNAKLRDKVGAVLRTVDHAKSNPRLRYAWDVANAVQHKLHSLDELNHAIHDHHSLPAPSEILTTWDRFHPYFLVIFEHLEKNGK